VAADAEVWSFEVVVLEPDRLKSPRRHGKWSSADKAIALPVITRWM
jgi:hypothetical protein